MRRIIFTGFSPNLTKQDLVIALKYLLIPWKWREWRGVKKTLSVESELEKYFGVNHAFCFDSGRTALHFALESLGVKKGDEVIVQALTCVVVVNAITWLGAQPVYVDIDKNFTIDVSDLESRITKKTKVLIIQHTFGCTAELEELLVIAKKNNLKVIEDCAHSFGVRYKGGLTGTFGDIGMLSFGSDKSLSCARGGALILNNSETAKKIKEIQASLECLPNVEIFRHLFHYPVFYLGKKFYAQKIGKVLLFFSRKFGLVNSIITSNEKQGEKPIFPLAKLANPMAEILLAQLRSVDEVNKHRQKIGSIYNRFFNKDEKENFVYLRYPLLVKNPKELLSAAKQEGIILGDWYNSVVAPRDININKTCYIDSSCPRAEKISRQIVNLPTNRYINQEEADKIINFLNKNKELL